MGITHRINRVYQDEHCVRDRWTSTDVYTASGDMMLRIPPCPCKHCEKLHSFHRFSNHLADNGAVSYPENDRDFVFQGQLECSALYLNPNAVFRCFLWPTGFCHPTVCGIKIWSALSNGPPLLHSGCKDGIMTDFMILDLTKQSPAQNTHGPCSAHPQPIRQ